MLRAALVSLALLLPLAARAQDGTPIHLRYSVYAAGVNVVDIDSKLDLRPNWYRLDVGYHTVGLLGLLIHNQIESFAQGTFTAEGTQPLRFASWGTLRGVPRRTVIDYIAGRPLIREQVPENDDGREPVPIAMQRATMDTLSALTMLVHEVAATGRCDGHVTTFDGRRVLQVTSRTAGEERLGTENRSSFSGLALRCDFEGRQLAGFQPDDKAEERTKTHHIEAWLAALTPGGPLLPVRVTFETHWFSPATAYLTGVDGGEDATKLARTAP